MEFGGHFLFQIEDYYFDYSLLREEEPEFLFLELIHLNNHLEEKFGNLLVLLVMKNLFANKNLIKILDLAKWMLMLVEY